MILILFLLYIQSHIRSALCAPNKTKYEPGRIVCDGVVFNDVYYDRELIIGDLGRPYNLLIHKYTGLIFFSHTVQSGSHVDFSIMACHVINKECMDIDGVPGGYAVAYDPGNDDIYFGGHDGIYKYNFLSKSAEFFAEEGKSIWGLFVKRNFYYIEYPGQKLYVYQDDKFVQVAEAIGIEVDNFYISKHNDVYFSNNTALFKVEKQEREIIVIGDGIVVRQIAEDSYGDIYFGTSGGIYIEEKPFRRIKKLADIDKCFGLCFDESDNVVYSDQDAIYKLVPSRYDKLCYDAIMAVRKKMGKENLLIS